MVRWLPTSLMYQFLPNGLVVYNPERGCTAENSQELQINPTRVPSGGGACSGVSGEGPTRPAIRASVGPRSAVCRSPVYRRRPRPDRHQTLPAPVWWYSSPTEQQAWLSALWWVARRKRRCIRVWDDLKPGIFGIFWTFMFYLLKINLLCWTKIN